MINIGERFLYFRKINDTSANKLAKALSVDPSTISKIERGASLPSIPLLTKYCEYFNITLADFFASTGTTELISAEMAELIHSAKGLSPEQIKIFTEAFKTIKND